jgi:phage terminase small subunit
VAELTPQQQRFVDEYLIDLNATQAAIRAGYSVRSADEYAVQLLRKTQVQEAVGKAKAERSRRTRIHADNVLEELSVLAFAHMGQYATWHDDSVSLTDSSEVDPRAVAEVHQKASRNGISISIKLHDKLGALKLLMQHLGMLTEQVNVQFDIDAVAKELADRYGTTPDRVTSIVERLRQKRAG